MIAYVLNSFDLSIRDLIEFEDYSFKTDIECSGNSEIVVPRKPLIENDDIIYCKDGNDKLFAGICQDCTSGDDTAYTIKLGEENTFFDRQILLGTEALIQSTGIEDFIASEISANWISSGDSVLDKDWMTVRALTHTTKSATVASILETDAYSVYNLKTFIGKCKEKYGVIVEFNFTANTNGICVDIKTDSASPAPIDTKVSDIVDPVEIYTADVLSKLIVRWINTTTQATSTAKFYLKTDRTVTTNASDPDRAQGTIKSVYIEAASATEMQETALQEFKNNSYQHKITLAINKDSRAYPASNYYVGRKVRIKTRNGVTETIVTVREESSNSAFIGLTFGKLKVTLIEKLRGKKI